MRLKVADFSTHFSGPLASHLLAELGAEVIKIEHHRVGDGNRELPPSVNGESVFHATLSAGARSIAVDSRSAEWPAIVEAAVRWADVVILAGPEEVLRRRGLGFETLAAMDDRLVYCRIPGFGSAGPWSTWNAHGQGPDAMAGTVELIEDAEGNLTTPPGWRGMGTTLAGTFAALGILAAVLRRDEVAQAQCLEVSLWASSLWSAWRDVTCLVNAGVPFPGTRDRGSRYAIYRTADNRGLQVAPIERKFWITFCEVLDLPADFLDRGDWETKAMEFGDGEEYAAEAAEIARRIATRSLDEWVHLLGDAGVPVAPLYTLNEAMFSDHAVAEGVLRTVPRHDPASVEFRTPRFPVRLTTLDGSAGLPELGPAPLLGEHSEDVRQLWGLARGISEIDSESV